MATISQPAFTGPVLTKAHVFERLAANEQPLRELGVRRCGLFGSFVHNRGTAESDVDLLVEFDPQLKTFDNFMALAFWLESLFGRRVEIVTPESLSPHIGPHILREVEYAPFNRCSISR